MASIVKESEVAHPDPTAKLQDASLSVPNAAPVTKDQVLQAEGTDEQELGDDEDDDDSDAYSNLSLYDEILNADPDGFVYPKDGDQDTCNQEHSKILRKRLRDVGPEIFVEETLSQQQFSIRKLLSAFRVFVPDYILDNRDSLLELLGFALYREMQLRQRLDQFSTVEDVVELLLTSKNIMVITGAGISTSLGIPDFRSKDTGFYSKLRKMGFEDPESVFNLEEFDNNPTGFYSLAGDLIPDLNKWSPTHQFIRILQDKDKLLRNYTQNIDNVESYAGINPEKIVHCHGSWKTASCRKCKNRVPGEELFPYLRRQEIARCKACEMSMSTSAPSLKRKRSHQGNANGKARKKGEFDDDDSDDGEYDIFEPGVMKPDITFFGESLPDTFYTQLNDHDRTAVDLVLVIGTSMKVAPVSEIPQHLARQVPHIYISRDPCKHIEFDVTLLGDCDSVVAELCRRTGWELKHSMVKEGAEYEVAKVETENEIETEGMWKIIPKSSDSAAPTTV